jgi:hypothetical protein
VSNVTVMEHMFQECKKFDQPLTWNTKNVKSKNYIFCNSGMSLKNRDGF